MLKAAFLFLDSVQQVFALTFVYHQKSYDYFVTSNRNQNVEILDQKNLDNMFNNFHSCLHIMPYVLKNQNSYHFI